MNEPSFANRGGRRCIAASLKLQGTDAQSHAVFTELKRVQQYFAKIKGVEEPEPQGQRSTTVNQEAAARILKADLVRSLTQTQPGSIKTPVWERLRVIFVSLLTDMDDRRTTRRWALSSPKRLPRSAPRRCCDGVT